MRSPWLLAPVSALMLATAVPGLAAPAARTATLDGVYTYQAGDSDDVEKAINTCVESVNFLIRGIAHGRLKETNKPYQKITIATGPKEISITTDVRAAIVTPADGTPIKWKREDGEILDVSTKWEGASLAEAFRAPDGQRTNVFTLSADGRKMTMAVTVTSSKLPKPLTYKIGYARAK